MKIIDIKPGDNLWDEVWQLYECSFPTKEKRSAAVHAEAVARADFNTRIAVEGEETLLGLLFFWDNPDYIYIEHIAVNPGLRGQSIGSKLLGGFLEANPGRKVILEIDPPEDDISIRRQNFYQRLGFVPNDYHYIHPGFGPVSEAIPHRLVLMSYPGPISQAEFGNFESYINEHVVAETES